MAACFVERNYLALDHCLIGQVSKGFRHSGYFWLKSLAFRERRRTVPPVLIPSAR
jgi:hypothetical protein